MKLSTCTLPLLTLILVLGSALAQDSPPRQAREDIEDYCCAIFSVWELNIDVLQQKIVLIDSLYQMPQEFLAVEQALNDSLPARHASIMAEFGLTIQTHLDFGQENSDRISEFLASTSQQAYLDSLVQLHDDLYLQYRDRRDAYNIQP
jgi:hypothetical protein